MVIAALRRHAAACGVLKIYTRHHNLIFSIVFAMAARRLRVSFKQSL